LAVENYFTKEMMEFVPEDRHIFSTMSDGKFERKVYG
jgi:hypothetical protein